MIVKYGMVGYVLHVYSTMQYSNLQHLTAQKGDSMTRGQIVCALQATNPAHSFDCGCDDVVGGKYGCMQAISVGHPAAC
jgi:hypothetical protein